MPASNRLKIPIIRPYMPFKDDFMAYADQIWQTRQLSNSGPLVQELEDRLRERLRVENLMVFANGHLALDSACKALGLCSGEVITTPFTFLSTAHALSMNGLKPIFCDIKESDCTIDEEKLEALITSETKAIVPVHVYGFPCNYERIQQIAEKYHLKVIYDAAHAFGVTVDGKGIGDFGDVSMFSFHATKVYHTVEGGAVTYHDPALTNRLRSAKNFGLTSPEEADSISFNAKMTELHAAMGLANLKSVDWQIECRKGLVEHYIHRLSLLKGIRLFRWDKPGVAYNYAYFPVLFEPDLGVTRDEIAERLEKEYHILTRKYFYPLLSDLHCYQDISNSGCTPIAKKIAEQVLTLPLFVEETHEQIDYICDAITEILSGMER